MSIDEDNDETQINSSRTPRIEDKEYNSARNGESETLNKHINKYEDDFTELIWENDTAIPEAK